MSGRTSRRGSKQPAAARGAGARQARRRRGGNRRWPVGMLTCNSRGAWELRRGARVEDADGRMLGSTARCRLGRGGARCAGPDLGAATVRGARGRRSKVMRAAEPAARVSRERVQEEARRQRGGRRTGEELETRSRRHFEELAEVRPGTSGAAARTGASSDDAQEDEQRRVYTRCRCLGSVSAVYGHSLTSLCLGCV